MDCLKKKTVQDGEIHLLYSSHLPEQKFMQNISVQMQQFLSIYIGIMGMNRLCAGNVHGITNHLLQHGIRIIFYIVNYKSKRRLLIVCITNLRRNLTCCTIDVTLRFLNSYWCFSKRKESLFVLQMQDIQIQSWDYPPCILMRYINERSLSWK